MIRKTTSILLLILAAHFSGVAQDVYEADCAAVLLTAENEFAAGRFYGLPSLLQACIDDNSFSNEEKLRVYMLLTQAYLLTDDPTSAEQSYLKLLAADPEFVASADKDPIDVVYLSKKFTTTPIFTPHVKLGATLSSQSIIYQIDPYSQRDRLVFDYMPKIGLTVGAGIEWNINEQFGIGGEGFLTYKAFDKTVKGIFGSDELLVVERQYWADIPLYLRYAYNLGQLRPYVYAGGAANFLLGDRLHLEYIDKNAETGEVPVEGPNIGIVYKRNWFNISMIFGGGVKYKWGKNFLLFDLRYMAGMKNVTNKEWNFYDDTESYGLDPQIATYANIGDLFRLNTLSFSVGFVRPLYDPRKVSKVRTKSVSRKITKE
jgi:opacity protein-like surface antigen